MIKHAIILLLITAVIMISGCGGSDVSQTVVQNSDKGIFKVSVNIPDTSILGKVIPLNSRYLKVTVTHSSGTTVTSDFVDLTTSSQVVLNNIPAGINVATMEIWDSTKTVLMAIRKYSFFMGAGQTASPPNNLMMGMAIDPNTEIIPRTVTFYLYNGTNRVYLENYDDLSHDITIQTYPPQTVHLNAVVPTDEANSIPAVFDGTSFYFNSPGTYNIYLDGSQTVSGQIIVLTQGGGGGGTPPSTNLNGVWVSEDGYAWTVGDNGRILHYTTTLKPLMKGGGGEGAWSSEVSCTSNKLNGVAFTPDGFEGWAVGNNGTMLYYLNSDDRWMDGNSFNNDSAKNTLNGLCLMTICNNIAGWAVGNNGTVLHYTEEIPCNNKSKKYRALNEDGWVTIQEYLPSPLNVNLNGVCAYSEDGKVIVWVVGNNGTVLHYNGEEWLLDTSGDLPSCNNINLNGVYFCTCYGCAVGTNKIDNTGRILFYDDSKWVDSTEEALESLEEFGIKSLPPLKGVYVNSDGITWIVGNNGLTLYFDGEHWSMDNSLTKNNLNAVHCDGINFAVGDANTIVEIPTPTPTTPAP